MVPCLTDNKQCLNVAASGIVYRMIATTGLFVHQWDVRLLDLAPFIRVSLSF